MTPDPVSSHAEPAEQGIELFGLTGLRAQARERVPIRTRASGLTTSAWRLEITCDQGRGAVVRVEVSPQEAHFRGDGLFLGWSPQQLAALHDALLSRSAEASFDVPQLG